MRFDSVIFFTLTIHVIFKITDVNGNTTVEIEKIFEEVKSTTLQHILVGFDDKTTTSNPDDENVENDVSNLGWDIWCKLQPNRYDCQGGGIIKQFYWDISMEYCRTTDIGVQCDNNRNLFNLVKECVDVCEDHGIEPIVYRIGPNVICRLQPDFGKCNGYYPKFYYDVSTRRCTGFSYSGCGGNVNRFDNYQDCSSFCGSVVTEE